MPLMNKEDSKTVYQLHGGLVERFRGYSQWSYVGFRQQFLAWSSGKQSSETKQEEDMVVSPWLKTRIQQDDYVVIGFPEVLADEFAQPFVDASIFWNSVIGETPLNPAVFDGDVNIGDDFPGCDTDPDFIFPGGEPLRLLILAIVTTIDGAGGTLGSAGACVVFNNVPRIGVMRFDSADVQGLVSSGGINAVIKHEMGHVVGIGTLWSRFGLVAEPCTQFQPCNTNPNYVGQNGLEGFNDLGGTGLLLVANQGGGGTANAHWRESTFANELMTGFLSSGSNPFSAISAKSLLDMNYVVDLDTIETYNIPGVVPATAFPTNPPVASPPTFFPTDAPVASPPTFFPTTVPTTTEEGIDVGDDVDTTPPEDVSEVKLWFLENRAALIIASVAIVGLLLLVALAMYMKRVRKPKKFSTRKSTRKGESIDPGAHRIQNPLFQQPTYQVGFQKPGAF